MALQDGFKVLGLNIIASGSGYDAGGEGDDLVLRMVAPGSSSIGVGDGFTGTYSCEDAGGPITEVTITAAGKNYSSGSWDASGGGQAKVGEHCSIVIFGATKNAPATGTGAIILPRIGQDASISFNLSEMGSYFLNFLSKYLSL